MWGLSTALAKASHMKTASWILLAVVLVVGAGVAWLATRAGSTGTGGEVAPAASATPQAPPLTDLERGEQASRTPRSPGSEAPAVEGTPGQPSGDARGGLSDAKLEPSGLILIPTSTGEADRKNPFAEKYAGLMAEDRATALRELETTLTELGARSDLSNSDLDAVAQLKAECEWLRGHSER